MKKAKLVGGILGVTCAVIALLQAWLPSCSEPDDKATFVEDLITGSISADDVHVIYFERERLGVNEIHKVTSRVVIAEQIIYLTAVLKKDAYRGYRYRNHPSCLIPKQIVEILLNDGSKYKMYGHVHQHRDEKKELYSYMVLHVSPRIYPAKGFKDNLVRDFLGDTKKRRYESRLLVEFIRKYSPFLPEEL